MPSNVVALPDENAVRRELEDTLVRAATELLAHTGGRSIFVPLPGLMPVPCIVIGDLKQIRLLVTREE